MTVVRHLSDVPVGARLYVADRLALREIRASGGTAELLPDGPVSEAAYLYLPPDPVREVRETVERLLDPDGCPWDRAQTHASLRRDLIEECFEAIDAIDRGDLTNLREELGDLLLHIALHATMEGRAGGWDLNDVASRLDEKLIRRHPHVFGEAEAADSEAVLAQWHQIKREERPERVSVLDGVPRGLAALHRALDISKRAAKVGFEWPDLEAVWAKVAEETEELKAEIKNGDGEAAKAELGDLLFSVVNVARWLKIDPEEALRTMVLRFETRFRAMETAAGKPLAELSPEEWDAAWETAKRQTKSGP